MDKVTQILQEFASPEQVFFLKLHDTRTFFQFESTFFRNWTLSLPLSIFISQSPRIPLCQHNELVFKKRVMQLVVSAKRDSFVSCI